ncbi:MAG: hypothetical protein ABIA04_07900 [Pseudomonadota bacterium]
MSGIDFLEIVSKNYPDIPSILLTGNADLQMAVDAVNRAVLYMFMLKPWEKDEIRIAVKRALEYKTIILKNRILTNSMKKLNKLFDDIEKTNPGITKVHKDELGRIILDENDQEEF